MKLDAANLKVYGQIASLLWKYGRSDLVVEMGIENALADQAGPAMRGKKGSAATSPVELADDLEAMGPTYVKLGQILSGRPDLLPDPYLQALARLQDDVKPFAYAEVEAIVTEDLGVRISKAFSHFDTEPLAAASLGQVHLASLRDGRRVAVKVQRPGIREQIVRDFEALTQIAELLEAHTAFGKRHRVLAILEEFRVSLQNELNYEREANNLRIVGRNLRSYEHIYVPQPIEDYCSRRVLTMDYVQGRKITKLGPLTNLEMPGQLLARELFKAYLQQVLVDGLFHADPHPGNVFLTSDHRVALLDLGMVGTTTPGMQDKLLRLLLAVSESKSDEAANIAIDMSETAGDFDEAAFKKTIAQLIVLQRDQPLAELNIGRILLRVKETAAAHGLYVPSELTLLGKTLLQLDEVGKILDPDFDPNAAIRQDAGEMLSQRMRKQATQGSVLSALLEAKDFVSGLPQRVNRILDTVGNSELEVKVRAVDADMVMQAFQKIANRITTGLVLAALIIGASLLMRVETAFTLFGYPGLAILCFLAAAAGGFWLVIGIFIQDHRDRKKLKR
jgi:ubiquinone biosynthesis protein